MLLAISAGYKLPASGMAARPHWFICHKIKSSMTLNEDHGAIVSGHNLGCETKAPNDSPFSRSKSFGAGAGSKALALAHIHDCFVPAKFAVQREVYQGCRWQDLDLRWTPTLGANDFISLHVYLTTKAFFMQHFFQKSFPLSIRYSIDPRFLMPRHSVFPYCATEACN